MLFLYMTMIEEQADQIRFEQIYHGYRKQMLAVANRVLRNPEDAEDAVQNALLGIARNIKSIPSSEERLLRAYVLTAAKNAALSLLPGKQRRDSFADISELSLAGEEDLFRQVIQSQDYALLMRVIRQLESPYREVLLLVYVHEHGPKAAADILCRKEETVRTQLKRGKKRLIELCRKEGMCFGHDETTNL